MLPVLAIDRTNQTDLVEHNTNLKEKKLRNLSVCLSRVSLALFMRLRLVSVVGESLWSGERPVDDDVQCFPGDH